MSVYKGNSSRTYYDTFHPYVERSSAGGGEEGFSYSFEDFLGEYNYHRPIGFTTACSVMPNVMSNTQLNLETNGLSALR